METNNIEQLKENIREYIKQNGNKEITGQILQEVLLGMVDAYPDIAPLVLDLANKVDKEGGKGLSTNDFTTALKNKLNAMPNITGYDATNDRITIGSKTYQLTEYVPTPDYYVGFANSSTANFQAMTKEQLMELVGQGKTVDSNPSHSGTWDEYILFVLKRTNVSIASASFTSIAGGGAQQLELATMHDNITIDGTTYNVVGKRLGVFNAGQDTFTINFSKQ